MNECCDFLRESDSFEIRTNQNKPQALQIDCGRKVQGGKTVVQFCYCKYSVCICIKHRHQCSVKWNTTFFLFNFDHLEGRSRRQHLQLATNKLDSVKHCQLHHYDHDLADAKLIFKSECSHCVHWESTSVD